MAQAQTKISPRRIALRTLREIEQRSGFSNRILSDNLERHLELERRDRGLITVLVYGVLRQRGRLDALIDAFAAKPAKLKGELRMILRLAVFEMLELGRQLAIANSEAGKLAKRIDGHGRLSKMVTAILRRVEAEGPALEARWEATPLEALCKRWSLPEFMAERWLEQLGPERALARAVALSATPTIDLRVDLQRSSTAAMREALLAEQPELSFVELPASAGDQPQCLRVRGGGDLFYAPSFEAGLISIQSLGSQQAVRTLAPEPGERVLDACAGMGTKTVQIAEHMQRRGSIAALDASAERLAELRGASERCSLDGDELDLRIIEARLGEGEVAELRGAEFDAVLLDAPCTGLGNLARHPELRWTTTADDIRACAETQARLLSQCAAWVRSGGRMVYAVCSLEPEEGELIVARFLSSTMGRGWVLTRSQAWTPEEHRADGSWLALLHAPT